MIAGWIDHKETCRNCGIVKIENKFTYAYPGHPDQNITVDFCWDCKQKMIGTRQIVVRYGNIPAGGKSYNYATGSYEAGASCYFPAMGARPEFRCGRPRLVFSAIVINTGGDDEPVIDANTIQAVDKKERRRVLAKQTRVFNR